MKVILAMLLLTSCFEKPLPSEVDGDPVPEEPSKSENNKTIEGVDSDQDGVRDDVERWINRRSDDPNIRNGLKQYTRYVTASLKTSDDKQRTRSLRLKSLEAIDCLISHGYRPESIYPHIYELEGEIANTNIRINIMARVEGHMGGTKFGGKSKDYYQSQCEFEFINK